jgi:hypothetical protein
MAVGMLKPSEIDYERIAKKLSEELAFVEKSYITERGAVEKSIQTWTSPTAVTAKTVWSLSRFYSTRLSDYTPPDTFPKNVEKPYIYKTEDYWGDDGYTIPSGYYNFLATYSKASLLYPFVGAYTKLPDLSGFPDGTLVYFGFEHGGGTKTGIASFVLTKTGGLIKLYVNYGSREAIYVDVTSRLPTDYLTALHTYYVKLNRWGAEFFIDNKLVAVALDIPEASQGVKATCPPYAVAITDAHVIKRIHTLLEIAFPYPVSTNIRPNPGSLTIPISPTFFRYGSDEPNPPRAYRLYQANSTSFMAGASISTGSLTSHPVPIYGREHKTFLFQANQNGTLAIEALTLSGNWITYDSVSYSANNNLFYNLAGNLVLARLTYTPATYPATVAEAEVILS